jgi:alpha 1,2-mannosyltransferase
MCHFWSNFEIADLNWLRGSAYLRYFEYLDRAGGFFYERWGDAPVHSIAAAIFLNKSEVHFFDDIGYRHNPFMHCPTTRELQKKCHCNADDNFGKITIIILFLHCLHFFFSVLTFWHALF